MLFGTSPMVEEEQEGITPEEKHKHVLRISCPLLSLTFIRTTGTVT